MTTTTSATIKTSTQSVDKKKFDDNFDAIFGKPKKVKGGSFIMNPETGKLVPRDEYVRPAGEGVNAPMVMAPMQDFVSPIDQTTISTRSQLEAHNRKHGVTNASDYSGGYIERKAHERVNAGQEYLNQTRRSDIGSAIDEHSR